MVKVSYDDGKRGCRKALGHFQIKLNLQTENNLYLYIIIILGCQENKKVYKLIMVFRPLGTSFKYHFDLFRPKRDTAKERKKMAINDRFIATSPSFSRVMAILSSFLGSL